MKKRILNASAAILLLAAILIVGGHTGGFSKPEADYDPSVFGKVYRTNIDLYRSGVGLSYGPEASYYFGEDGYVYLMGSKINENEARISGEDYSIPEAYKYAMIRVAGPMQKIELTKKNFDKALWPEYGWRATGIDTQTARDRTVKAWCCVTDDIYRLILLQENGHVFYGSGHIEKNLLGTKRWITGLTFLGDLGTRDAFEETNPIYVIDPI